MSHADLEAVPAANETEKQAYLEYLQQYRRVQEGASPGAAAKQAGCWGDGCIRRAWGQHLPPGRAFNARATCPAGCPMPCTHALTENL